MLVPHMFCCFSPIQARCCDGAWSSSSPAIRLHTLKLEGCLAHSSLEQSGAQLPCSMLSLSSCWCGRKKNYLFTFSTQISPNCSTEAKKMAIFYSQVSSSNKALYHKSSFLLFFPPLGFKFCASGWDGVNGTQWWLLGMQHIADCSQT